MIESGKLKKNILRIFTVVLCVVLLICAFPLSVFAANKITPLQKSEFYGRSALSKMPRGSVYVKAYDRMVDAIKNREAELDVRDFKLNKNEMASVRDAVRGDPHEDYWWYDGVYYYSSSTEIGSRYVFEYYDEVKQNFASFKKNYETCFSEFIDTINITPYMSQSQIVREVHDKLALQISYTNNEEYHVDTEYGAFVDKKAECDGYASAFRNALAMYGIQSFMVTGKIKNSGGHAWNIIRIDGKYYQCDLTWNDDTDGNDERGIFYYKYNLTSEEMLSDRYYYDTYIFDMPNCTATSANFYVENPKLCLSTTDPLSSFAALEDDGFIRVYVTDKANFSSWYKKNIVSLATLLGYSTQVEIDYDYIGRGSEYHIYIRGVRIDAADFGDKNGDGVISYNEFYGRCALAKMPNGKNLVEAYDRIYDSVENLEPEADLSDLGLDGKEHSAVFFAYMGDPTGHFWVDERKCTRTVSQLRVVTHKNVFFSEYTFDLEGAKKTYNDAVDAFKAGLDISDTASDYEISLAVHDALAKHVAKYNSDLTFSAYYAMIYGKARCEGYSYAYADVLADYGVLAFAVFGIKDGYRHTWNLLKVDGEFCYTDICCDDRSPKGEATEEENVYYNFFNVSQSQIETEHVFGYEYYEYPLPAVTTDTNSFFAKNPERTLDITDSLSTFASFEKEGVIKFVYDNSQYDTGRLTLWFDEYKTVLAGECGYVVTDSLSVTLESYGNEHHIIIKGMRFEDCILGDLDISGKVNSADSYYLKKVIAGAIAENEYILTVGDMDGNDKLSSVDSFMFKRMIAGAQ